MYNRNYRSKQKEEKYNEKGNQVLELRKQHYNGNATDIKIKRKTYHNKSRVDK